jgi:hypothetical protein
MEKFELLVTWPPARGDTSESWLFDFPHPTALDVHLTVFIARMLDVGRDDLFSDKMRNYAARAMQTDEWKSVMQGRKTMIPRA